MANNILSPAEEAVMRAIAAALPNIPRWLSMLTEGDADATRQVADILPERSASQAVADELRETRREG